MNGWLIALIFGPLAFYVVSIIAAGALELLDRPKSGKNPERKWNEASGECVTYHKWTAATVAELERDGYEIYGMKPGLLMAFKKCSAEEYAQRHGQKV